jgi:hypothetical protein
VIALGGVNHLTDFDASTGSVSAAILASEIANAGSLDVTVTDRGLTSNVIHLNVARPSISSLSPSSTTAGNGDLTLTVRGTGFLSTSVITFNGVDKTTTFDAASGNLSTTLTASELASPRIVPVTVRNTAGAESLPSLFTILSPGAPQILALTPASIDAGSAAQPLFVTGVNFLPASQVSVNGVAHTTTYVSANELDITLSAAELATAGVLSITISNPDGTISPAASLVINFTGPPPPRRRSAPH